MNFTEDDIGLVMRHTTYTEPDEIMSLLYDYQSPIAVITQFVKSNSVRSTGSVDNSHTVPISSVNQEIYKQIRSKMNLHNKK